MMRFSDKVALVTGGRTGIGKAIADRLREEGARVDTVQRNHDPDHECITADLADPATPARVVAAIAAQAGRLDVLVNNAGIMRQAGIEGTSIDDWSHDLAVNLTAPFLMVRSALAHLRATRGCIVNIGSIEGLGSQTCSYCACQGRASRADTCHRHRSWQGRDPLQRRGAWVDRHAAERGIYRIHGGCGGLSPRHRQDSSGWQDGQSGRDRCAGRLPRIRAITGEICVDGGRMAKLSLPG